MDIYLRGIAVMNRTLWVVACISCFVTSVGGQDREAVVKKDALSVHTVERGSMPIFTPASGALTSLQPRRAVLTFDKSAVRCEAELAARLVVAGTRKHLQVRLSGAQMLETVKSSLWSRSLKAPRSVVRSEDSL